MNLGPGLMFAFVVIVVALVMLVSRLARHGR